MSEEHAATTPLQSTRRKRTRRANPAKPTPTKTARLEALLRRPKGATIAQLEHSLGWQPHTVRAAISRLRKGGAAVSLDQSGKTAIYRLVPAA